MCADIVEEMDERYLRNLWMNDLFIGTKDLLDVVEDSDHVDKRIPKNPKIPSPAHQRGSLS